MNSPEELLFRLKADSFVTDPFACAYLAEQQAQSQVILPNERLSPAKLGNFLRNGFRRSGFYLYRPFCAHCRACLSVRIPCARFAPNRSQQRTFARYAHLSTTLMPLAFTEEIFDLYTRYQHMRHNGGGMDDDDPNSFAQFMLDSAVESRLVAFRDSHEKLLMVSLMDFSDDGASAVYTFFDPQYSGLGTYAICWQNQWVRSNGGDYLYLGYWIEKSRKMNYKKNFQPLEQFSNGHWQDFAY